MSSVGIGVGGSEFAADIVDGVVKRTDDAAQAKPFASDAEAITWWNKNATAHPPVGRGGIHLVGVPGGEYLGGFVCGVSILDEDVL